jgi:hypothetical protein
MKKGIDMYRILLRTLPASAPGRLIGLLLIAAVLMGVAAAVVLEPHSPAWADGAVETAGPAPAWARPVSAPPPLIDHSAIDWDRLPVEPNPSPLSVAAYGD